MTSEVDEKNFFFFQKKDTGKKKKKNGHGNFNIFLAVGKHRVDTQYVAVPQHAKDSSKPVVLVRFGSRDVRVLRLTEFSQNH